MNKRTIKELPRSEQPEEIFKRTGERYMTDAQLLAAVLRCGSGSLNVLEMSEEILKVHDGSLINLSDLSYDELMEIKGVGKIRAMQLKCIAEISRRIATTSRKKKYRFMTSKDVALKYMEEMRHFDKENAFVLFLNTKMELLSQELLSVGTVNKSLISPRELFNMALKRNAVNVILLHNHPSGDPTPSDSDIEITRKLADASDVVGIKLIDHIIIGDRVYFSMNDHNMI